MNSDDNKALHVWRLLWETGDFEGLGLSSEVSDSWTRSKMHGVDPYKPRCDVFLGQAELTERRANNSALIKQATMMMGHLYSFLQGPGLVLTLGDNENHALEMIGDPSGIELAESIGLIVGSRWSEDVMGTNCASLAQMLRKPVQTMGHEVYCGSLTIGKGATCPILSDEGDVIGYLSATGPHSLGTNHTLGLVVAASRAIERQMALTKTYDQIEMANLEKTAIAESVSDGVLTLDQERRITYINSQAAINLGVDYRDSIGLKITELMVQKNELFVSKICDNKMLYSEPLVIRRENDRIKLAVSNTPLRNSNGTERGTVIILQPIRKYPYLINRAAGGRTGVTFDHIIGDNPEFKQCVNYARIAARSDSNVLLLGESGVGKEMFAQAIHNASSRRGEPFLAINCAALPRELVSSELFGYEEGAFTGARKGGNPGKFELADQGTILLDEISEMSLDIQGALLRVLEEGTITRLGGKEEIPVNVRIIAATNRNLLAEVEKQSFRLDIYYRLGVIDINIPPLRERRDDIPRLVEHFLGTIGAKLGKNVTNVDGAAMNMMLKYHWPGNARELSNVIERAINMADGSILTVELLPPSMKKSMAQYIPAAPPTMEELDEQMLRKYLQKHQNNRSLVASDLGISRSSLYRKLKEFSIL